jgi:hypothetical protein
MNGEWRRLRERTLQRKPLNYRAIVEAAGCATCRRWRRAALAVMALLALSWLWPVA